MKFKIKIKIKINGNGNGNGHSHSHSPAKHTPCKCCDARPDPTPPQTKKTYPYGITGVWTYGYDGYGLLSSLSSPDGGVTSWNRNADMQVTSIVRNDKDGTSTETLAYDAMGDITSDVIARGADIGESQSTVYDALGRPYQRKGANGQVDTYAYDGNANVISITDALGNKTSFQYDALDRLSRTVNAGGGITQNTYDLGDNVTRVTDPRGLVTSYSHDGLGQLWTQVSPDSGTTTRTFDGYGRPSTMTRADGTLTSYGYDSLNRVTVVTAGGQTQSLTYDACTNGKGHLCADSDATGTTSYSYTPEGWVAGRSFSMGGTVYSLGYNYDGEGRLTVVTYPDGNKAVYYRTNGMVNSVLLVVGSSYISGATNVTYRPADLAMASWTSSNGLTNAMSYDKDMRLTGISVPGVQSLGFTYDSANRITKITNGINSNLTETLNYDALSRLTTVVSTAENESYQYDADGNRTTATVNGLGQTYTIAPGSNRLMAFSSALSAQYGYDPNGNTTMVNGATGYQYNPFNRLISASGATDYVNPEGQRLRKAGGSTGTTYFAPGVDGELVAENDNGAWVDYVRLNGRLIGRIGGGQVYAIHDDQVGRPEEVTDASKAVVWRAQNYPFTQNVTLANITLNLGFPGQYYDAERWTWNNGFRDYNSGFGRYLESDPIGLAGGVNTYAYVGNEPLAGVDPLGLCKCQGANNAPSPQQYAAVGKALSETSLDNLSLLGDAIDMAIFAENFKRGGVLDAQVRYGGTQGYANYTYGVTMSAYGMPLTLALSAASGYAQYSGATATYATSKQALDPNYPGTTAANVSSITNGYNDQTNGTMCTKN